MVEVTFLGTGTSTGVPVIGCDCETCRSTDLRDKRLRASVLVRAGGATLLVDTSPDLRTQMLRSGTRRIDAVLFTHEHADHTAGLDELRTFNELQQQHIPVYASPKTAAELRQRFGYAFQDLFPFYGAKPDLTLHEIDGPFTAAGVEAVPVPVLHGRLPIIGFRFGPVAYVTDVKTIPLESLELLRGLDLLIINALRRKPHFAHLNLDEAMVLIEDLQPRETVLTHLSHDMGRQADVEPDLPPNVRIAHDGLTVAVDRATHPQGEEAQSGYRSA